MTNLEKYLAIAPRAVIDIGSNSVRLLVTNGQLINTKEVRTTQLAENLARTGKLSEEAAIRTVSAIKELCQQAKSQTDNIRIFGTEAVRSAVNKFEFAQQVEDITGIPVEILSGDVEAEIGYIGATLGGSGGKCNVLDIGGASVEVVCGEGNVINFKRSLPIGLVRMINLVGSDRAEIEKFVGRELAKFGDLPSAELISIGGTSSTLVSMKLDLQVYDAKVVHGHQLSHQDVMTLVDVIFSHDVARLTERYRLLSPKRAMIIGHGAIMLAKIMEKTGVNCTTVSELDNLEGYVLSKYN